MILVEAKATPCPSTICRPASCRQLQSSSCYGRRFSSRCAPVQVDELEIALLNNFFFVIRKERTVLPVRNPGKSNYHVVLAGFVWHQHR